MKMTTRPKIAKGKIELKNCPCCGGTALPVQVNGVKIACGKFGCIMVEAKTMKDAAALWNAKDFRYARHD